MTIRNAQMFRCSVKAQINLGLKRKSDGIGIFTENSHAR